MGIISFIYGKIKTRDNKFYYIKDYYSNGSVIKVTLSDDEDDNISFTGKKDGGVASPNYTPLMRVRNILKQKEMKYLNYSSIKVRDTYDSREKSLPTNYSKFKSIKDGTRIVINDEINKKVFEFRYNEDKVEVQKEKERKEKILLNRSLKYRMLFGKYKDKSLNEIYKEDINYLIWLKKQYWVDDFLVNYINKVISYNKIEVSC